MNGSSCASLINPTAEKIGYIITQCLTLIVSLVGNSFIALTVHKTQTLRKPINYFIVNMAMSDMLYPIFQVPSDAITVVHGLLAYQWSSWSDFV